MTILRLQEEKIARCILQTVDRILTTNKFLSLCFVLIPHGGVGGGGGEGEGNVTVT